MERVELAAVVQHAIEIAQPVIDAAGHKLMVSMPDEKVLLDGDPTRLAQVFSNVLINSAKYTPANGSISLGARREGDQIAVRVKDTGIGIAEEHLGRIFKMFGRSSRRSIAPRAGKASASRSPEGWSSCTAGPSTRAARASARAASSRSACRPSRRPGDA
jgi:signal transduction histidine kinase